MVPFALKKTGKGKNKAQELGTCGARFLFEQFRRNSMRASIVILLTTLTLAACGSTHKTVVVAPPEGSTTVVDKNGDAHVITHDDDRR